MNPCISCNEVKTHYCEVFNDYRESIQPFIDKEDLTQEEIMIALKLQQDFNIEIVHFQNLMLAGNCGCGLVGTYEQILQIIGECLGEI